MYMYIYIYIYIYVCVCVYIYISISISISIYMHHWVGHSETLLRASTPAYPPSVRPMETLLCNTGRSGPCLKPETVRVYISNGSQNGLTIGRKVGLCPGTRRLWVLGSNQSISQAAHAANTRRFRFQVRADHPTTTCTSSLLSAGLNPRFTTTLGASSRLGGRRAPPPWQPPASRCRLRRYRRRSAGHRRPAPP